MKLCDPVIVVPGITASYLKDEYQISPEFVWTVLTKKFEKISLHPDDLRYEAEEPARVTSGQVYEVAYKELIEELRYNLSDKEDLPVPVYPFGYDWRMPLEYIQAQLDDFIQEVIDRTKLMPHYHREKYYENPKVNLVGHSMGGLVIAGYLDGKGGAAPVNKVATLASPFQGSFEAVIKVTTGTANLGTSPPSSREREAARLTPALYHLTPSFKLGLDIDKKLPQTLYNIGTWQNSILQSIEEIIRLKGLPTKTRKEDAKKLFEALLKEAKGHRKKLDNFNLENAGLSKEKWLAVVGVDSTTRVKLTINKKGGSAEFAFRNNDRLNEWGKTGGNPRYSGDGTVPYEGAVPKFLNENNLVLITPDDYGYWEIQDRALTKVAGFHGILPNMNMLHRMIVRFFKDLPDKRRNTWARPAPGVSKKDWDPPLKLDS